MKGATVLNMLLNPVKKYICLNILNDVLSKKCILFAICFILAKTSFIFLIVFLRFITLYVELNFTFCVNTENGIKYRMVIGRESRKAAYRPYLYISRNTGVCQGRLLWQPFILFSVALRSTSATVFREQLTPAAVLQAENFSSAYRSRSIRYCSSVLFIYMTLMIPRECPFK